MKTSAFRKFALGVSARAPNGKIGESFHGDFVGYFESELEIGRDLGSEALERPDSRKCVIGGVNTDGFEDLGVFAQAISLEA